MFYYAYVARNRTATKSGTSSVNENENSLPADTNTPSVDSLRRRSWSLDSKHIHSCSARNNSHFLSNFSIWPTKIYFDRPYFPYIFNGTVV